MSGWKINKINKSPAILDKNQARCKRINTAFHVVDDHQYTAGQEMKNALDAILRIAQLDANLVSNFVNICQAFNLNVMDLFGKTIISAIGKQNNAPANLM